MNSKRPVLLGCQFQVFAKQFFLNSKIDPATPIKAGLTNTNSPVYGFCLGQKPMAPAPRRRVTEPGMNTEKGDDLAMSGGQVGHCGPVLFLDGIAEQQSPPGLCGSGQDLSGSTFKTVVL